MRRRNWLWVELVVCGENLLMEQISCRELGKTHYVFFLTGSIMSFFKLLVLFSTLKQLTLKQSCFNAKILKNV